jgi:hypothetical protein
MNMADPQKGADCTGESLNTVEREPASPRERRRRGSLFGLAIGDALGAAVEFRPRGSFSRVPIRDESAPSYDIDQPLRL